MHQLLFVLIFQCSCNCYYIAVLSKFYMKSTWDSYSNDSKFKKKSVNLHVNSA